MAGAAKAVAEQGYGAATIAEITTHARVSPRTFYEHFSDKLDCFLAAYDTFAAVLLARMDPDEEVHADWREFVSRALRAYLGSLEENSTEARAFLVEIDGAGPTARRRRHQAYARFAALIRERHELARGEDPSLAPLPERVYMGIVHGVRELVCDALESRRTPKLTDLEPDVLLWISATIYGAGVVSEHQTAG